MKEDIVGATIAIAIVEEVINADHHFDRDHRLNRRSAGYIGFSVDLSIVDSIRQVSIARL